MFYTGPNIATPKDDQIVLLGEEYFQKHEGLKAYYGQKKAELESIGKKIEQNKQSLRESFNKNGNQPQRNLNDAALGQFQYEVEDVESTMREDLKHMARQNANITNHLLEVHKLLEKNAQNQRRIQRNASRELGLRRQIDDLIAKSTRLTNKLNEHEQRLSFNEHRQDISENKQIQQFEELSLEMLMKMKSDYVRDKIILDRCKYNLEEFGKELDRQKPLQ